MIKGHAYPNGVGKTKKEAKRNAAKHALIGMMETTEQKDAVRTAFSFYSTDGNRHWPGPYVSSIAECWYRIRSPCPYNIINCDVKGWTESNFSTPTLKYSSPGDILIDKDRTIMECLVTEYIDFWSIKHTVWDLMACVMFFNSLFHVLRHRLRLQPLLSEQLSPSPSTCPGWMNTARRTSCL